MITEKTAIDSDAGDPAASLRVAASANTYFLAYILATMSSAIAHGSPDEGDFLGMVKGSLELSVNSLFDAEMQEAMLHDGDPAALLADFREFVTELEANTGTTLEVNFAKRVKGH